MSAVVIGWIVFACVFGGALFGLFLRAVLPEHHLSADSKDIVKLGTGLIATMSALVLGLLIASAKSSYDRLSNDLTQISANLILLDRVMAHYGPETKEARALLYRSVVSALDRLWPRPVPNMYSWSRRPGPKISMTRFMDSHRRTTLNACARSRRYSSAPISRKSAGCWSSRAVAQSPCPSWCS